MRHPIDVGRQLLLRAARHNDRIPASSKTEHFIIVVEIVERGTAQIEHLAVLPEKTVKVVRANQGKPHDVSAIIDALPPGSVPMSVMIPLDSTKVCSTICVSTVTKAQVRMDLESLTSTVCIHRAS